MTKIWQIQFCLYSTKSQQSLLALYCKLKKDPFEQTLGNTGERKTGRNHWLNKAQRWQPWFEWWDKWLCGSGTTIESPKWSWAVCAVVQYLCPDLYFSYLGICVMTSQSGEPKHRHKTLSDSGCRLSSWVEGLIPGMHQSDIQYQYRSNPGLNYWIGYWDEIKNVTRPIKYHKSASQNLRHRITQCMVSHMLLCYFRKKKEQDRRVWLMQCKCFTMAAVLGTLTPLT